MYKFVIVVCIIGIVCAIACAVMGIVCYTNNKKINEQKTTLIENGVKYVMTSEHFDESKFDYVTQWIGTTSDDALCFQLTIFGKLEYINEEHEKYGVWKTNAFNCIVTYKNDEYYFFVMDHEGY